ncbi:hypothetical protein GNF09_03715 [Nostoc sp. UCD120]|nr:hypothetical protein [Nostoc sp. UCD120]
MIWQSDSEAVASQTLLRRSKRSHAAGFTLRYRASLISESLVELRDWGLGRRNKGVLSFFQKSNMSPI